MKPFEKFSAALILSKQLRRIKTGVFGFVAPTHFSIELALNRGRGRLRVGSPLMR
jgi:hypothetical protein